MVPDLHAFAQVIERSIRVQKDETARHVQHDHEVTDSTALLTGYVFSAGKIAFELDHQLLERAFRRALDLHTRSAVDDWSRLRASCVEVQEVVDPAIGNARSKRSVEGGQRIIERVPLSSSIEWVRWH